ncbi:glutathione S-transferase U7 [Jatropha curcas]|uniref:glutathione S-transferase U7 n=1 Tax=Jatropha curcas TaxID=180498 RepID=UPI001895B0D4|nr:glutathione S-transferase U7 [Jatropha curcas]
MAEEVKLFGMWASGFSHTIEIALKLKGIQFQYIEEDLSNKSPLLLKYNPVHKKVPVLLHNGKPIAESLVILEYIDETWKNDPLLPENPYERAKARFWSKFVQEKVLTTAFKTITAEGKEKKQLVEEIHQQIMFLENELKEKEFFGGETIGYLDIVAFCILNGFRVTQEVAQVEFISEEKFPVLCKWIGKLLEIGLINECLPPRDKHIAHVRARIEAAKSSSSS